MDFWMYKYEKAFPLKSIEYAMLQDLAKKSHLKPDQYLKSLIQKTYGKQKR